MEADTEPGKAPAAFLRFERALPEDTGRLAARAVNHGIIGIDPKKEADAELGSHALELIIERLSNAAA